MSYTRGDKNRGSGLYGVRSAIEFDGGVIAAVQDDIHLGVLSVVVFGRITADLGQMNSSGKFLAIRKRSAGDAAWALDGR